MAEVSDENDPSSVPPHCINFTSSTGKDDSTLDDPLFSLDAHPSRDMIATGTITGNISL